MSGYDAQLLRTGGHHHPSPGGESGDAGGRAPHARGGRHSARRLRRCAAASRLHRQSDRLSLRLRARSCGRRARYRCARPGRRHGLPSQRGHHPSTARADPGPHGPATQGLRRARTRPPQSGSTPRAATQARRRPRTAAEATPVFGDVPDYAVADVSSGGEPGSDVGLHRRGVPAVAGALRAAGRDGYEPLP